MSDSTKLQCVYIVQTYGTIVGVFLNADDAYQQQKELVMKNRPAVVRLFTL